MPAEVRRAVPVGILAALLAVGLVAGGLERFVVSTTSLAEQYVRALGPQSLPLKAQTLTLQRAALAETNVLPIYGTSELYCCGQPYNAATFFQHAPTGFSVFNVGYPVTEDLFWAQTFGALGNELRGKRLVVSDSPWFMSPGGIAPQAYAHTFSPEIAEVFTFDAPIPMRLRGAVARRMLAFPTTLQGRVLLVHALRAAAHGGWRGRAGYWLLDPTGRLAAWGLEIQDAVETRALLEPVRLPKHILQRAVASKPAGVGTGWLRRLLHLPPATGNEPLWRLVSDPRYAGAPIDPYVPIRPQTINWNTVLQQATQAAAASTRSNPFGVATSQWQHCTDIQPVGGSQCASALALYRQGRSNHDGTVYPLPRSWVEGVITCTCWTDLDLEFEMLRAVHAQPMAWVQPIQGALADETPYSAQARRVVYDRYLAIARAEGIPATTFQTHDTDPLFINSFGHLSQRGWVYADRLLDLFWHGRLAAVAAEMNRGGSVDALFPPALNCPHPTWCEGVDNVPPLAGELADLPIGLALPLPAQGR